MTVASLIYFFRTHLNQTPKWKGNVLQKFPAIIEIKYDRLFMIYKNAIFERIGLNAARKFGFDPEFIKPMKILLEGDTCKVVIDARFLDSLTDVSKYHFLELPFQV